LVAIDIFTSKKLEELCPSTHNMDVPNVRRQEYLLVDVSEDGFLSLMSDALRQSTTDKATSAMKPDSQKSMTEKAGDSIKSTADNVAGSAQPSGEKGVGQKASDAVSGTNNDASKQGQSVLDSASETLGNAAQSAQDALGMGKK